MWGVTKKLWHTSDRDETRTNDENHTRCSTFSKFFATKIEDLKHSIQAKMLSLTSSSQYPDCPFTGNPISNFLPITPDEVSKLLLSSSTKSSRQDFIPTSLIKSCSSVFSALISTLVNLSFSEGTFPSRFKLALVSALIKKHGLDKEALSNYRPISNLNNISKILEQLLLARVQDNIISSTNFNPFQSAYRKYNSTETALLLTLDNIFHSIEQGMSTVLVSLDLSAAFDTIDHSILLNRLKSSFGIHGTAFSWFHSYLSNRTQFVQIGNSQSSISSCPTGVPKASYLVPCFYLCIPPL